MLHIALEGIDGSGKSHQAERLRATLEKRGARCIVQRLYGNSILNAQFERLNDKTLITARDASLMTAADLAGRLRSLALDGGEADGFVLWDKFVAGSRARDRARGVPEDLLEALYDGLPSPDLTIFLSIPPEQALKRKRRGSGCAGPTFWESGLDLALNLEVREGLRKLNEGRVDPAFLDRQFVRFQTRVAEIYPSTLPNDTVILDGTGSGETIATAIVDIVERFLHPIAGGAQR